MNMNLIALNKLLRYKQTTATPHVSLLIVVQTFLIDGHVRIFYEPTRI